MKVGWAGMRLSLRMVQADNEVRPAPCAPWVRVVLLFVVGRGLRKEGGEGRGEGGGDVVGPGDLDVGRGKERREEGGERREEGMRRKEEEESGDALAHSIISAIYHHQHPSSPSSYPPSHPLNTKDPEPIPPPTLAPSHPPNTQDPDFTRRVILTWIQTTTLLTSETMAQHLLRQPHPHSIDFLRNRDPKTVPGPFDGKVGAFAEIGGRHYFITSNADYVPGLPSLELPHAVFLRLDMRYGTDDPALWPQQFTQRYCHMPAIAQRGARPELQVMWWNPSVDEFEVGSAVTRGLGRLKYSYVSKFLPPINKLIEQCKALRNSSPKLVLPLFGELIQHILIWIEQLQTLPTTFSKMLFVTSLQHVFLELNALYNYMTIYKPRIDNYLASAPAGTAVAQCVGVFTTVPTVAQQLWAARLPFWFLRPVEVFDSENIWTVVALRNPMFGLSDPNAHGVGAPPVLYTGNSTEHKIAAINHVAAHTPWYYDPFETTFEPADTRSRSPSPDSVSVASTSWHPVAAANIQQQQQPYPTNSPAKKAPKPKGPAKIERDKFSALQIPEMPPSIACMADSLALVDRGVVPSTSNLGDKRYVLPKPTLLVNTSPLRCRKFLQHWKLLVDGFIYMLTQHHPLILSSQEWRDILEGLLTKRGKPGSRTYRQSEKLENVLCPALDAFDVGSFELFPVPNEELPEFSLEMIQEIVWEVAETSFRFEFCTLDRRASGKDRLNEVKGCFTGHMLVGVPLAMSKCGWASTMLEERHRYAGQTAILMLDWTTKSPRPDIIRRVSERLPWSPSQMQELETAVCRYYTQAFWEYFGCPAIVPLRLDHAMEKEDGQL
ncbi:hypothetical protein B0H10DRAFT_2328547 [Mycena sp. CBHHK59/15]|nr:hypothetical protein B0H10DRAFT_2328547 [Mycena sp. CBHHK59/15]